MALREPTGASTYPALWVETKTLEISDFITGNQLWKLDNADESGWKSNGVAVLPGKNGEKGDEKPESPHSYSLLQRQPKPNPEHQNNYEHYRAQRQY